MGLFCNKRCQDRKDARVQARTDRVALRQETKQVAFQNGMDPNAAMWGGISSLGGSIAGIFGKPGSNTGSTFSLGSGAGAQQQSMGTYLLLALAAVAAWFIFKK